MLYEKQGRPIVDILLRLPFFHGLGIRSVGSITAKLSSLIPGRVRVVLIVVLGLCVAGSGPVIETVGPVAWGLTMKLQGKAPGCPLEGMFTLRWDLEKLDRLRRAAMSEVRVKDYDEAFGVELISLPHRDYWIRKQGEKWDGRELLANLTGEHEWIASQNPDKVVQMGDIVVDCGAHVGVFVDQALRRGAKKVIAIDPDPIQIECLRRNFSSEIAAGKVVVVPKAVWSREDTLKLHLSARNSGMSSVVEHRGGEELTVAATTIDRLVVELNLERVDYIKFDIEGAEREALKGAVETLSDFRPRLLIDSYHREDDMAVLPQVIAAANPDYELTAGPCHVSGEYDSGDLVPFYAFYD